MPTDYKAVNFLYLSVRRWLHDGAEILKFPYKVYLPVPKRNFTSNGYVRYQLKRSCCDGTTHVLYEPAQLKHALSSSVTIGTRYLEKQMRSIGL